jgi:glycosyltransferase involved in cell wall biosynthesis
MQVLMVISQFYPLVGGAEKQAQLLARKLMERGVTVDIVTGWWKFGTSWKEVVDGIRVFRNFCGWGIFGLKRNRAIRMVGGLIYMMSLSLFLIRHKKRYDLIHIHQVLYPAFVSALIAKGIFDKPILVKMGCSGLTGDIINIKRFPFGRFQLKYLIKKVDLLVTVNHEGKDEFKAIGFPESKIQYIPNGIGPPPDGKNDYDEARTFITTVRLDPQKGIDILLKAWHKVTFEQKGLKLLILGQGPCESELKDLAKALRIEESVQFVGLVSNVGDYLEEADIFVLPSRAEGMSNALIEAMSFGLSCIATKISGNTELMGWNPDQIVSEGDFFVVKNGILINPDDVEGLAKAILFLIHNAKVRKEVGIHGRSHIQNHFSIDSIADRYVALYRSLLQEN